MKTTLSVLAICLAAACGGTGGSVSNVPSGVDLSLAAVDSASGGSFQGMLNDVRLATGAGPLIYNSELGKAAQRHADDMYANNFMEHTGSDGSTLGSRIGDTNYNLRIAGENIARGYPDEESVLRGWINSEGHQRNNINPEFEDFALAKAGSGQQQYWALVLGAEY